jgi:hypothetical protein
VGHRTDSYHCAEIHMRKDEIKLEDPIEVDLNLVSRRARVPRQYLAKTGKGLYSVGRAAPKQTARILDVIFRHYLEIRPYPDEDEDDYGVIVEW